MNKHSLLPDISDTGTVPTQAMDEQGVDSEPTNQNRPEAAFVTEEKATTVQEMEAYLEGAGVKRLFEVSLPSSEEP